MSVYSKNPDVVFRTIADEFILVPIRQKVVDLKSIFTLNPAAAFIWENIDGKNDAAAIKGKILESFEVLSSQSDSDVDEILSVLESLGLIQKS
jgi:hypothetical protein